MIFLKILIWGNDYIYEIIDKILQQNSSLFNRNPKINKVDIGLTNTKYNVNDLYIIQVLINKIFHIFMKL